MPVMTRRKSGQFRKCRQEGVQCLNGGHVGDAIHPLLPEMPLEGFHRYAGLVSKQSVYRCVISVEGKHGLESLDGLPLITRAEIPSASDRNRRNKMTYARVMQLSPRKVLARIELAARRYIRMAKHALRRDHMSFQDGSRQVDDRSDLVWRIGWQIARVARIDDLDTDGTRIDVGLAFPVTPARVPGTQRFRHQLYNPAIFMNNIVA